MHGMPSKNSRNKTVARSFVCKGKPGNEAKNRSPEICMGCLLKTQETKLLHVHSSPAKQASIKYTHRHT